MSAARSVRPLAVDPAGYTQVWPAQPESVGRSRDLLRPVFRTWRLPDPALESWELIISDLVANAVAHSGCKLVRISVTRLEPSRVRIAVTHNSKRQPRLMSPTLEDAAGRGLHIVAALAKDWWVRERSYGKTVCADLTVDL